MVCVGLLTTTRIFGGAVLRGWVVLDAGLTSGTAGLELLGGLGDSDLVSVLGVGELSGDLDWVSEPDVSMLGVWDSELVWALAGKASIAPKVATLSKRQCLWKTDRRIPPAPLPQNRVLNAFPKQNCMAAYEPEPVIDLPNGSKRRRRRLVRRTLNQVVGGRARYRLGCITTLGGNGTGLTRL